MLRMGEWRPMKEGDCVTAGFRLNGMYSPLGWLSWAEMLMEFNKAKGDAPLIKTFVNTRLSETFEIDSTLNPDIHHKLDKVQNIIFGQILNIHFLFLKNL